VLTDLNSLFLFARRVVACFLGWDIFKIKNHLLCAGNSFGMETPVKRIFSMAILDATANHSIDEIANYMRGYFSASLAPMAYSAHGICRPQPSSIVTN
jgi:hypothetical protein